MGYGSCGTARTENGRYAPKKANTISVVNLMRADAPKSDFHRIQLCSILPGEYRAKPHIIMGACKLQ